MDLNCIHCDEPISEDHEYPRELSYGYRHDNGSLFCASSQMIARPSFADMGRG
jgi:hypothetical protein